LLGLLALTITAGVVAVTAMNARPARGGFINRQLLTRLDLYRIGI
jgi:hypothetical protein